jgi:cell division protein FtsQ
MTDTLSADQLPADIRWMRLGALALAGLLLLVLLAAGIARLLQAPLFDWRALRIEGDVERNSLATLRAHVLPELRGNFISTDLTQLRDAFEAVAWVRSATVRRAWPPQLVVTLEEHQPVATWDGRGDWGEPPLERALLNRQGEVFQANLGEVEDENLPAFAGPSGSEAQVLQLWHSLAAMAARQQLPAERLELSGRGAWRLTLQSGAVIELGRGEQAQVEARFARFLPHAQAVARRFNTQIQSADLRHPDGYALRLVGIATSLSPSKTPRKKP